MTGTYLRGSTSDPEGVLDYLDSESHDVVFDLGNCGWQDIAVPGMNLLHILNKGDEGEVYPYDGVGRYARDGRMHVTYTLGGFLVGFDFDCPEEIPCRMQGTVCAHNAVTTEEAQQIVRAVSMDWTDSPEGFVYYNDDIDGNDEFAHNRMDLMCGVSVCVDDSMAWVETIGCSPYVETFDITGVTTSRDSDECLPCEGGCLWLHTDRCIIGLPIGEVN